MTTTTVPPATDYPLWQQQWWLERQKLRRKRGLPELGEDHLDEGWNTLHVVKDRHGNAAHSLEHNHVDGDKNDEYYHVDWTKGEANGRARYLGNKRELARHKYHERVAQAQINGPNNTRQAAIAHFVKKVGRVPPAHWPTGKIKGRAQTLRLGYSRKEAGVIFDAMRKGAPKELKQHAEKIAARASKRVSKKMAKIAREDTFKRIEDGAVKLAAMRKEDVDLEKLRHRRAWASNREERHADLTSAIAGRLENMGSNHPDRELFSKRMELHAKLNKHFGKRAKRAHSAYVKAKWGPTMRKEDTDLDEGWFHNNDTAQARRLERRKQNHMASWPEHVGDKYRDPSWSSRQNERDNKVLDRFKRRYKVKGPNAFLRDTDYTPSPVRVREHTELTEVSKDLLHRYIRRATTEHGMAHFAMRSTEQTGGKEHAFWKRKTATRKKGISRAFAALDKKGT